MWMDPARNSRNSKFESQKPFIRPDLTNGGRYVDNSPQAVIDAITKRNLHEKVPKETDPWIEFFSIIGIGTKDIAKGAAQVPGGFEDRLLEIMINETSKNQSSSKSLTQAILLDVLKLSAEFEKYDVFDRLLERGLGSLSSDIGSYTDKEGTTFPLVILQLFQQMIEKNSSNSEDDRDSQSLDDAIGNLIERLDRTFVNDPSFTKTMKGFIHYELPKDFKPTQKKYHEQIDTAFQSLPGLIGSRTFLKLRRFINSTGLNRYVSVV
jgi:hypothetical protein